MKGELRPLSREELKAVVNQSSEVKRRYSIKEEKETFTFCACSDRLKAYKNLFGVCVSFICCFGSFLGILSLQSSINSQADLGLASNSVIYTSFMTASFIGPLFVKLTGSKYGLITGYVLFLLYTLCNYYPSWYTLIPGAILNGIGQPPIWIAVYAHVISVAIKYAPALKETTDNAIALFAGTVAMSVMISQIFGSLISSLILISVELNTTNTTIDECISSTNPPIEPSLIYYTLISTYVLVIIIGILVAVFFLDHLGTEQTFASPSNLIKNALCKYTVIFLKTSINWRMIMITPMNILNGIELGFLLGIFSKTYILECAGIHFIGFALAVYGIGGVITAYTAGRIVRYQPQFIIVYCALAITLGLGLLLLFWERESNLWFIFGFSFAYGLALSTINSVVPGLLGQWFKDEQKETAIGMLQIAVAIGAVISFVGGIYLTLTAQLWILVGFTLLTTLTYSIVYFIDNHTKSKLCLCCFKENIEEKINEKDEIEMDNWTLEKSNNVN